MRVSTDPADPAYIDARPRKAWCNDRLIENWAIADEFRRCVIDSGGKVHNGAVLIERLPAEGQAITGDGSGQALPPIHAGFSGMFVPEPKPTPAPSPAPAPAAPKTKPRAKRRR